MRLIIKEIFPCGKDIFVKALTETGLVSGKWEYRKKPLKEYVYQAEFGIDELSDDMVSVSAEGPPFINCLPDDTVVFCGICEDIDEDFDEKGNSLGKCYYIRFSPDGLFLTDVKTDKIQTGDTVTFTVSKNQVKIYPY